MSQTKSPDSAREYNMHYLDQVISPLSTIERNLSTASLPDEQRRLDEKHSDESSG